MEHVVGIYSASFLKDFLIVVPIVERDEPLWDFVILANSIVIAFNMHVLICWKGPLCVVHLSILWSSRIQVFSIEER